MKHLLNLSLFGVLALFFAACTGNSTQQGDGNDSDSVAVVTMPDTAVYGIIDESTTMHMLTIILEDGKTKSFSMNLDSIESDIQGGLFAGDKVTLTVTGFEGQVEVEIVDMNGRRVASYVTNDGELTVNVSEMAQGAYFVRVTGDSQTAVRKLIVK